MKSAEIIIFGNETVVGAATMRAIARGAGHAGMPVKVTSRYRGKSDWLAMFAASQVKHRAARFQHIATGRPVACWDHGYLRRNLQTVGGYMRVSVNDLHPTQALMQLTKPEPSRWLALGIETRNEYEPRGPVVIAGIGGRSRMRKGINDWELETIKLARQRFPDREIVFRPRPGLGITDSYGADRCDVRSVEDALRGAALLICTHSNIAIDACIAGIPVQCGDGAAHFLYSRGCNPTLSERLDFLYRVAWWQWRVDEMGGAWKFLTSLC